MYMFALYHTNYENRICYPRGVQTFAHRQTYFPSYWIFPLSYCFSVSLLHFACVFFSLTSFFPSLFLLCTLLFSFHLFFSYPLTEPANIRTQTFVSSYWILFSPFTLSLYFLFASFSPLLLLFNVCLVRLLVFFFFSFTRLILDVFCSLSFCIRV